MAVQNIDPNRLPQILNNTGLQNKDNPLYQLLFYLINRVITLNSQVASISGGSSSIITGLTPAQVAARILLDGDGDNGVPGPIGPAGVQGSIGIPGMDGDPADIDILRIMRMEDLGSGDQSFNGNLKPSTMQMFSWTSRSSGTVYQAASDGLFLAFAYNSSTNIDVQALSDSSNPPTTERSRFTTTTNNIRGNFCIPVRKGDFYEAVVITGNDGNLHFTGWWVPFGVNG